MAFEPKLYDTATLLGTMLDDSMNEPVSHYWLDMFGSQINFDDEYVDFSKMQELRKIAPLVVPTVQGKPIYSQAEHLSRVKPAYVKAKDPISAAHQIRKRAGFGELHNGKQLTPMQRYQAITADILKQHRKAIERRWEWLACRAIIDGQVTLEGDDYPKTVVDFQRDAGHTKVLGAGSRWGDAGVNVLETIESYKKEMRRARHGGAPTRLTLGALAWEEMRNDTEIRDLITNDYRSTTRNGLELNLGITEGEYIEKVGTVGGNLEVYVYSDFYEDAAGATIDYMAEEDMILTGPSVSGVRCFGAIQDISANFVPNEIFSKMWNENDPSVTYILSQSAPLMVPVNPNATMKVQVVA